MKTFHIGDVLTVTTGRLLGPTHMDGLYEILNYMTGESLMTHALGRAAEVCRPVLLERFPELATVNADDVNAETHLAWLAAIVTEHGETREVAPLDADTYEAKDPITELLDMGVEPEKIAVVGIAGDAVSASEN